MNLNTREKTMTLTKLGMLAAVSLLLVLIQIPFPPAPFLKYDPADVPIFIGTFAFGPLAGLLLTVVVSFFQAFALGGDGLLGFFMHVVSTGSFVLAAGLIYKRKKTKKNAVTALICGTIVMPATMLGWNMVITPIFLGVPREAVLAMLMPVILPFNLMKAGVNALITFFTYKYIARYLHKKEPADEKNASAADEKTIGPAE